MNEKLKSEALKLGVSQSLRYDIVIDAYRETASLESLSSCFRSASCERVSHE